MLLLRTLAFLLLLVAFSGCEWIRPVLHVAEINSVPRPNRLIEINSIWASAKPLNIKVRPPGLAPGIMDDDGGRMVTLRGIHDGRVISILASWSDPTESRDRSVWVWNDKSGQYFRLDSPSDFFAIKFSIAGARDACMMSGGEGVYDVWEWRAGWTHITGYADDLLMRITRTRPEAGDFRQYPLEVPRVKGSGIEPESIFIQLSPDRGDLPYEWMDRPRRRERAIMPAIRARPPSGSTGDIFAEAVYENGGWALELYRHLSTGNEDDYPVTRGQRHYFSIAIGDGQEGAQHLTSELIRLKLD